MLHNGSNEDCAVDKSCMEAEECEVKLFHAESSSCEKSRPKFCCECDTMVDLCYTNFYSRNLGGAN